jgi:hypothetical protein
MAGSGVAVFLSKLFAYRDMVSLTFISSFLMLMYAIEGWIQFSGSRKKWLWMLGGLLTGIAFVLLRSSQPFPSLAMVFMGLACMEFFVAMGARKRPWIWLIATPLLYGLVPKWAPLVESVTRKVMDLEFASLPVSFVIPQPFQKRQAFSDSYL